MNTRNAFFFLQLPIAVVVTLFIAGVVVPSRVRSDLATNQASAAGVLHSLSIAGMGFWYTNQNVGSAMLGALVGATAAIAIHFHVPAFKSAISTRMTAARAATLRH